MIIEKNSNLINLFEKGEINIIVEQLNCFHTQGGGIAKIIKDKWPQIYEVDCKTISGDKKKMGNYVVAKVPKNKYIIGIYSQFRYGYGEKHTSYDAFDKALTDLRPKLDKLNEKQKITLGFPYGYGSVLGGGRWTIIRAIIGAHFEDAGFDVLIVRLPGTEDLS